MITIQAYVLTTSVVIAHPITGETSIVAHRAYDEESDRVILEVHAASGDSSLNLASGEMVEVLGLTHEVDPAEITHFTVGTSD